ncbi:MAG: hypothetical protein RI575_13245 [Balneolaceae bacterium]|nr:hypothetical protein [Balneolaceae bacterium]MDR9407322.1 hypothetical protein [Balneolaceae bacterium]
MKNPKITDRVVNAVIDALSGLHFRFDIDVIFGTIPFVTATEIFPNRTGCRIGNHHLFNMYLRGNTIYLPVKILKITLNLFLRRWLNHFVSTPFGKSTRISPFEGGVRGMIPSMIELGPILSIGKP